MEQNQDKVKEIDKAGFDIGTHSNTHPKMSTLSKEQIESELKISSDMIKQITHVSNVELNIVKHVLLTKSVNVLVVKKDMLQFL